MPRHYPTENRLTNRDLFILRSLDRGAELTWRRASVNGRRIMVFNSNHIGMTDELYLYKTAVHLLRRGMISRNDDRTCDLTERGLQFVEYYRDVKSIIPKKHLKLKLEDLKKTG